jgi:hypothetical protein
MRSRLLFVLFPLAVSACGGNGGSSQPDGNAQVGDGALPSDGGLFDGGSGTDAGELPVPVDPGEPAVKRGGTFFGFAEQFNRHYTDSTFSPSRTIFVSPTGGGNGATRESPTTVGSALGSVGAGEQITFVRGTYSGCFELTDSTQGTYDAPIVLFAERNNDGSRGVRIDCCTTGRRTCINLEAANYVAVDGFELVGGAYGVRAVGADFAASQHQKGVAVLGCEGHGQSKDPFFTGQSDWAVFEGNLGHGAGSEDGHGLYISNGSDFNIVRKNELHSNMSSDFQINADANFPCDTINDASCDALAGTGEGGRGASDYFLVELNYFHHGLAQGPNFTSVRESLVRNNVFALYERHGTSFWQETDNPNLGSRNNRIHHNLFISRNHRHMLQFVVNSGGNDVRNNLFLGVTVGSGSVTANPDAVWMEVDGTVSSNTYAGNYYVSGQFDGRSANSDEHTRGDFDSSWFAAFPTQTASTAAAFQPSASAPYLNLGALLSATPQDFTGKARSTPVDIGPFERD